MSTDGSMMTCRNCGDGDVAFRLAVNGCNLDTCANCGYLQVRDIPTDTELRNIYGQAYFEKPKYVDDQAARHEFTRRLKLLREHGLQASWRVLDYGCAAGEFVSGASPFCEPWGADFSAGAIAKAQARYPALADRYSTLAELHRDILFDAVVMWDVIEHVPSPAQTLAEVSGLLRPGGLLMLSTPNSGAPVARLMGRRWAFMTPPEHLGFFDRRSMVKAMDRAGFDVVAWSSRGKLVNVAFLLYKAGRVLPLLAPEWLRRFVSGSPLGRLCVYVPTGDIQYVVCRRRG